MKNPWIKFAALRLGVFAAVLTVLLLLQAPWIFAVAVATAVGFAFSLVFLGKSKSQVSTDIYERIQKKGDKDSDVEDEIVG